MSYAASDAPRSDPSRSVDARPANACPRHAESGPAAAPESSHVPSPAATKQTYAKPTYAATIKPTPWPATGPAHASTAAAHLSSTGTLDTQPQPISFAAGGPADDNATHANSSSVSCPLSAFPPSSALPSIPDAASDATSDAD